MRGKLIVIEGTDCSGKETQSNILIDHLRQDGIRIQKFSYPNYTSPTGKIIGGPYLGKETLGESWFEEGPSHVDPKVSALYYAADRKYNIHKIIWLLENGVHVLLDRYVYSNMAHQGGKIEDTQERIKMYDFLDMLEFGFLELPKPDIALFLHMPQEKSLQLRELRGEKPDGHERDNTHLANAEKAYKELAKRYSFTVIECANPELKSIEEISEEVYSCIKPLL